MVNAEKKQSEKGFDYRSKIQKLLALAERAGSPEEAETFTAKATELMIEWGVTDAHIQSETKHAENIGNRIMMFTGIYSQAQVNMANVICHAVDNVSLVVIGHVKTTYTVTIFGHDGDTERVVMLITSLVVQQTNALEAWWTRHPIRDMLTKMEKFKERRQFIFSYGSRIAGRIREQQKQQVKAVPGTDLVLVDRKKKVEQYVARQMGPLRTTRSRTTQGSAYADDAGRRAANNADLGGQRIGRGVKGELNG